VQELRNRSRPVSVNQKDSIWEHKDHMASERYPNPQPCRGGINISEVTIWLTEISAVKPDNGKNFEPAMATATSS